MMFLMTPKTAAFARGFARIRTACFAGAVA